MNILALETSARAVSCALLEGNTLVAAAFQNSGLTHSRTLMPMVSDLLKNCDRTLDSVEAIACAVGPGSFTGLRIGVAAAKGLAWGRELPCIAVSTLEAMAYMNTAAEGILCPVMDARRSQFYNAMFECHNGTVTRLCEDRAIDVNDLAKELEKGEKSVFLVGDGAELCYNMLLERHSTVILAPEYNRWQRAEGVALCAARMAAEGKLTTAGAMTPVYLRLSQAERERLERLGTL